MGDDIDSGLLSMAVCSNFCSAIGTRTSTTLQDRNLDNFSLIFWDKR